MAAHLVFARAPHIGGIDRDRSKRARAADDDVIGLDRAELEREGIERALELSRDDQQRRGEPAVVPAGDARGAGAQIVAAERVHDGHRLDRRRVPVVIVVTVVTIVTVVMRLRAIARLARSRTVDDQRLQPRAEDGGEVALQRLHRVGNGHDLILCSFPLVQCLQCVYVK